MDDLTEDEELARAIAQSLQDPGTSAAVSGTPAGASGGSVSRAQANGGSGAAPSQPLPKGACSNCDRSPGSPMPRSSPSHRRY